MPGCTRPGDRPVLAAVLSPAEARLIDAGLAELGVSYVMVEAGVEAMQALCRRPNTYAAVVVRERVGRVSGFTLCGLARDADCGLPMLLLTRDEHRWAAGRAARLGVSVIWQPATSPQVSRALPGMLQRRRCGVA